MARDRHLDERGVGITSLDPDPREQFITRTGGGSSRSVRDFNPYAISARDFSDRMDYGYGQMMNPQQGARQTGRWLTDSDALNPNVFERQVGSSSYPGAAKNLAQWINRGGLKTLESPRQLRDVMSFLNEFAPYSIDHMYKDVYGDEFHDAEFTPEMYTSKREQIEDEENPFVANLMDRYGRDNPFLQELGGTTTTIDPYGGTTEEYTDLGYGYREPYELDWREAENRRNPYMDATIGNIPIGEREALYDESLEYPEYPYPDESDRWGIAPPVLPPNWYPEGRPGHGPDDPRQFYPRSGGDFEMGTGKMSFDPRFLEPAGFVPQGWQGDPRPVQKTPWWPTKLGRY